MISDLTGPHNGRWRRSPLETFATHPFVFLWQGTSPTSDDEAAVAISDLERRAADLIIQNEPHPASKAALGRLFMPYHQNGTFVIGARRGPTGPPFIRGESGDLVTWIRTAARSDLVRMLYAQALPSQFESDQIDHVAEVVSDAFHYSGAAGKLYDQIPNQNYIDYVRRAIGLYVCHDANFEFYTEGAYNEFTADVILGIIQKHLQSQLSSPPTLATLRSLMVYSLLAGVIGLDMKCSHCAASLLTADNAAASQGQNGIERTNSIYEWLVNKATDRTLFCNELFAWDFYQTHVLSRPCTAYVFPDDLGETILDLFRLQAEMTYNPGLRVVFVPRNGRFHNDFAIEDVAPILDHDCFEPLRRLRDQGRFALNENGPKNGSVERPKLNHLLVNAILEDADILFFKGSRSYEMIATGIRVRTFSGQTVSREFSESVTGASAEAGVPVLRFFHAFPDYWGFTERHRRIEPLFPTDKLGWHASMTAIDSARFTDSGLFRAACNKRGIEDVALDVMIRAAEEKVAPHQVRL
jgi:hypothetical protein